MTAITSAQSYVQIEETRFGTAISEYTATKVGANINYIYDNYQPLSYIPVASLSDNTIPFSSSSNYTFVAPYRLVVYGFSCSLSGTFSSFSGTNSKTISISSAFTTGSFSNTTTVTDPSTTTVSLFGAATSFGTDGNFSSEPSAVAPITLNAGETTTLTVTVSGAAFFTGVLGVSIVVQKELAP